MISFPCIEMLSIASTFRTDLSVGSSTMNVVIVPSDVTIPFSTE